MNYNLRFGSCTVIFLCADDDRPDWAGLLPAVSYFMGQLTILYIFIIRINYTFKDSLSIYAFSQKTIKLLQASFVFTLLVCAAALITWGVNPSDWVIVLAMFIFFASFLGNYIALIVMFFKRITKSVLALHTAQYSNTEGNENLVDANKETEKEEEDSCIDINDTESTAQKPVMIDVRSIKSLIRYEVAVTIAFASTVTIMVGMSIAFGIDSSNDDSEDDDEPVSVAIDTLGGLLLILDSCINCLCIYLQFLWE